MACRLKIIWVRVVNGIVRFWGCIQSIICLPRGRSVTSKKGQTLSQKAVAYIDIPGFRSYTSPASDDRYPAKIVGAAEMLRDFYGTIDGKTREAENHPSSSCDRPELAKQNEVGSFDLVLPFSDCCFIVANDPDWFVVQLAQLLLDVFRLTSHAYRGNDPTRITRKVFSQSETGVSVQSEEAYWHALIYRGGISYGDVLDVKGPDINLPGVGFTTMRNVLGPAVVQAVNLEQSGKGKGPRITCDGKLYGQLSSRGQNLLRPLPGTDSYELLWPMLHFTRGRLVKNEVTRFNGLFDPVVSLWKAQSTDLTVASQYLEMMKLIARSTDQFFSQVGLRSEALEQMTRCVRGHNLEMALLEIPV